MPQKPIKPGRTLTSLSLPTEHLELYRQLADADGIPFGDWVAVRLARSQDLPEPEYVEAEKQKRLRKKAAAARRLAREQGVQELPIGA
ncbi:hypothetical protein ACFCV3_41765 [Kribbella sp. NPDC056345]|uniref:hypothetical protein n=1 Tax=Kribbella sp. NPDC056345 TaxID=3345789 RepID=UPI0035D5F02D